MRIKGGVNSSKLLLALAVVAAFSFAQPVKAEPKVQAGPTFNQPVSVPDTGSSLPLLGFASLGLLALRRKLGC